MREKSDSSKHRDGRGVLTDEVYEAWKTAREAKSTGTACAVYDPIQGRTVNLLSRGEVKVFWALRYMVDGRILDQHSMDPIIVRSIAKELGIKTNGKTLSTDFLVEKNDGTCVAISVKPNAAVFEQTTKRHERNINRQRLEVAYWARFGIPHHIVFSDDIDNNYAMNIKDIMMYWDEKWVKEPEDMLMHMMAHKVIQLPMDKGRLPFRAIAKQMDVEYLYETYSRQRDNPNFPGWRYDLVGRKALPYSQPSTDG